MANIHGNGLVGRIEMTWDSTEVVIIKGDVVIHTGKWVVTREDERYYYVKDHLGSIRHTYDTSGVAAVAAQDYLPFGGILREYNNASPNERYKFTEKERDRETSYDYFGARYYDSDIGRWLSVDPLADLQPGINPYHYSFNNPLKYTDPTGMMPLFETIDELHDYLFPEFADDPSNNTEDGSASDDKNNKKTNNDVTDNEIAEFLKVINDIVSYAAEGTEITAEYILINPKLLNSKAAIKVLTQLYQNKIHISRIKSVAGKIGIGAAITGIGFSIHEMKNGQISEGRGWYHITGTVTSSFASYFKGVGMGSLFGMGFLEYELIFDKIIKPLAKSAAIWESNFRRSVLLGN
ncbi:MAG: RHS repeat-associated core domain-containing protein [Melioribacteraceae bacterium]|nr:RHS repeat-associated core domain-containing protein [Melioribacteraceae bacterium]MCF8396420.1 RHS repeat-associated core domain-containing protein [Melioribacteraceae bacterium]MCF8420356.1 RHS repeat-associated core domain-containing protein [Melioribacteraceae bacterium]